MLKFAANLTMMFNEVGFLDRFKAAYEAGFENVEYLFPYAFDVSEIKQRLDDHSLTQALFNASAGDWEAGQRGFAAVVGCEPEFKNSIEQALEYAAVLGNKRIHVMSGVPGSHQTKEQSLDLYLGNISWAAEQAKDLAINILIEPINNRDMPGYFMNRPDLAMQVISEINQPNLKMQFDFYHAQIICGDIMKRLDKYGPNIDHIQIASVPDRHEPDSGELNYPYIFEQLKARGYEGYIGCEYRPAGNTVEGLRWFNHLRGLNG